MITDRASLSTDIYFQTLFFPQSSNNSRIPLFSSFFLLNYTKVCLLTHCIILINICIYDKIFFSKVLFRPKYVSTHVTLCYIFFKIHLRKNLKKRVHRNFEKLYRQKNGFRCFCQHQLPPTFSHFPFFVFLLNILFR